MCRYGVGKWRLIQKDEDYGPILTNRSNVDLKVRSHSAVWYRCSADGLAATLPERFAACCCFSAVALLVLMTQVTGHSLQAIAVLPCLVLQPVQSTVVEQYGLSESKQASLRSQLLCPASCSAGLTPSAASAGQVAQPQHGLHQEQEAGCRW